MFKSIQSTIPKDQDLPDRAYRLSVLAMVIEGTLYDSLRYPFTTEKNDAGEYVPILQRRPSVRYGLCRTVVDDSVSLLFSEGHFPAVVCTDEDTRDWVEKLIKETKLNEVMIAGATTGSVGSVCFRMRILKNRVFFDYMSTAFLTPTWDPEAPDTLLNVAEKYKVKGSTLKAAGYTISDDDAGADFWFQRIWDSNAENWYMPWKKGLEDTDDTFKPSIDESRTVKHSFGFVPLVWTKNLPGGDAMDGGCTFAGAIDTNIEIDYLLSQNGRGLRYNLDPTLMIKEPAEGTKTMVKGAGNALIVSGDKGDAKLLEIDGNASAAVVEWVTKLRELALESIHGNRSNADKLSTAQSGRAMELMNQALIWLSDKLRISYGEGALLDLLNMIVKARKKFALVDKRGNAIGELSSIDDLSLRWPAWYAPTYADKQTEAISLETLTGAGILSRETATTTVADSYGINDPADELAKIKKQEPLPGEVPPAPPTGGKPKQSNLADAND